MNKSLNILIIPKYKYFYTLTNIYFVKKKSLKIEVIRMPEKVFLSCVYWSIHLFGIIKLNNNYLYNLIINSPIPGDSE